MQEHLTPRLCMQAVHAPPPRLHIGNRCACSLLALLLSPNAPHVWFIKGTIGLCSDIEYPPTSPRTDLLHCCPAAPAL